jgi:hypothetical protein
LGNLLKFYYYLLDKWEKEKDKVLVKIIIVSVIISFVLLLVLLWRLR